MDKPLESVQSAENAQIEKMWRTYIKTREPALKDKLILHYVYLVKLVVGRLRIHVGTYAEYDDMISYGIFGLIDAVEKFDASKGAKFETYASLRIRGSVIDSLRKMDWVPRNIRHKSKEVGKVCEELESELGREPTEEELAEKLGCGVDKVSETLRRSAVSTLISLDDYLSQNHEPGFAGGGEDLNPNPETVFTNKEQTKALEEALNTLNNQEKRVMSLYYFEELTLREISMILEVSESRVSQIHSKAVLRLRNKLGERKFFG